MPPKTGKSGLAAKLGTKLAKAVAARKGEETKYDQGGDLPAPMQGIARLSECKFGQYKEGTRYAGEYFFLAQGVVVLPKEVEGMPVEGLITRIGPEPICDTPDSNGKKTVEDHVSWVLNEMRKLGLDTSELTENDLEEAAATLKEMAPYFRFRTWQGKATPKYPNPSVQHTWSKAVDYAEDSESRVASAVVDDSDVVEASDEPVEAAEWDDLVAAGEAANGGDETAAEYINGEGALVDVDCNEYATWAEAAQAVLDAQAESSDQEEVTAADDDIDLDALGAAADGNGADADDAVEKLAALAEAAGLDADEYPRWSELATALAGDEPAELEEFVPVKGTVVKYKVGKKLVECDVVAVFAATKKANLKNLDNNAAIKNVPWSELVEV